MHSKTAGNTILAPLQIGYYRETAKHQAEDIQMFKMWLVPFQGYKRNVFLIVEKVCDCYGAVADPCAQEHEESNPGLHFTALQST